MFLIDYMTTTPRDELLSSMQRVPSTEFAQIGSWKGRAVCVWKTAYHAAAIVVKPVAYIVAGAAFMALSYMIKLALSDAVRFSWVQSSVNLILTGLVSPLGQIMQLFKAAMGILHPGCYFKENDLDPYFTALATIAQEVGCEASFVDVLKNGSQIIASSQQISHARVYYHALFKRDLAILVEKLSDPNMSKNEKLAVIMMLAPLPSDPLASGIYACPAGFGRLLEQICCSLDIPKEEALILPWLVAQFKVEILHQMLMEDGLCEELLNNIDLRRLSNRDLPKVKSTLNTNTSHYGNLLIAKLGDQLKLPPEMIENASRDLTVEWRTMSDADKSDLMKLFESKYTEEALASYLMNRLNSQPDGSRGLYDFRKYIIQKLTEGVSEEDCLASKQIVEDELGISSVLSDEPIYYVKLHHFLHPLVEPEDERSTDLNKEGIRAFAATLENNPFNDFLST